MEIFYEGHWRMDWGLGNPNKTAVLIAELMIASWVFAFWSSRPAADAERRTSNVDRRSLGPSWGFWLSVTLSVVLGGCLIMTYSRGGMVAALCGLGILLAFAPRPWARRRVIALLATSVILGAYAFSVNATGRYRQGIGENDPSITNRLLIWKTAPRMMVDAPTGWGWGRSGNAYMQWYQPVDRLERYRSLVNSHLTWMVEMGWPGRTLYITAWSFLLMLCWPTVKGKLFPVPFALWIVLGVGAFFSSVGESVWIWILPGLALLCMVLSRFRVRFWPKYWIWATAMVVGVLVLGGFYLAGSMTQTVYKIHGSSNVATIQIDDGSPSKLLPLWIVSPDRSIVGEHYGHAIRSALTNVSSRLIGVAMKPEAMPLDKPVRVLIMGKILGVKPPPESQIILLNPSSSPAQWQIPQASSVKVVWGEYSQNHDRSAWETLPQFRTGVTFEEAPGAAQFIPNWVIFAMP